jgi:hypothetical protein
MKVDIVNDVVPPVVVTVVNIASEKSAQTVMGQSLQRILNYAMTVGGYLSAAMGWGGRYSEMLKNVGIASAPGTLVALYNQIAKPEVPSTISRPISMRRMSRYPGPPAESPFQGVRLV